MALAPIRTREFSLPRGWGGSAAFQLYSSSFPVHNTGSLLLSLYAPRYCLTASAGFGRQFTKLRALSRLRRRYDSRKYRISPFPSPPSSPYRRFLRLYLAICFIFFMLGGQLRRAVGFRRQRLIALP